MISVHVDDATFQRNLNLYLNETSKTTEDAINFKLYDGCRESLKQTPKANKSTIVASLNERSSKYPNRSVAEMIVIKEKEASGEDIFDLEAEVQKLKGKRTSHIAFVKAGYLPGIKILLRKVGKAFASISGVTRSTYGGAEPVRKTGSTYEGSFWNDVEGSGNKSFVEQLKQQGADAGVTKINSDMVAYLEKKLGIPADKFNRS